MGPSGERYNSARQAGEMVRCACSFDHKGTYLCRSVYNAWFDYNLVYDAHGTDMILGMTSSDNDDNNGNGGGVKQQSK